MSLNFFTGDGIDESKITCPECNGEGSKPETLTEEEARSFELPIKNCEDLAIKKLLEEEYAYVKKNLGKECCTLCDGDGHVTEDVAKEYDGFFDRQFDYQNEEK